MKKFVFTLDSLLEVKKTLKDKLQAEYAAAEALLEKALRKKEALEKTLADESEKYEAQGKKGISVGDIQAYIAYLGEVQEMIKAGSKDIDHAQKDVNQKQTELTEVFKEIKSLEKLRRKQYLAYIMEEKKQETNLLEDILSFHMTGEPTQESRPGAAYNAW